MRAIASGQALLRWRKSCVDRRLRGTITSAGEESSTLFSGALVATGRAFLPRNDRQSGRGVARFFLFVFVGIFGPRFFDSNLRQIGNQISRPTIHIMLFHVAPHSLHAAVAF